MSKKMVQLMDHQIIIRVAIIERADLEDRAIRVDRDPMQIIVVIIP